MALGGQIIISLSLTMLLLFTNNVYGLQQESVVIGRKKTTTTTIGEG